MILGLLGYRDIELSAKVLGFVLVLEIVTVLAIDLGVLFSGRELLSVPLNLAEAFVGAPGLGPLFAFLGFFGFEATAVFRNEARDPERTVSRATYITVITIGVLYFVSSRLVIAGIGVDDVVATSTENPDHVVIALAGEVVAPDFETLLYSRRIALAGEVVAPIVADIVQVLVVTSMFACMLSFHNIVTRYLFTLGQRGVLPTGLAAVHEKHRAPSTPVVVSAVLGGIGLFLVFGISVWNLPMLVGSVTLANRNRTCQGRFIRLRLTLSTRSLLTSPAKASA